MKNLGLGTAEWEGGSKGPKSEALIYWHTPEDWANLIWNWVTYGTAHLYYYVESNIAST